MLLAWNLYLSWLYEAADACTNAFRRRGYHLFWNIYRLLTLSVNQKTVKNQNRKWKIFQSIFIFWNECQKYIKPLHTVVIISLPIILSTGTYMFLYKNIYFSLFIITVGGFDVGLIITRHEEIRVFVNYIFLGIQINGKANKSILTLCKHKCREKDRIEKNIYNA